MKVNLGSGPFIKRGYLNIDMLNITDPDYCMWDLNQGLPLHVQNISYVYSSHFLEHLTLTAGFQLLKDCFNKMQPGGVIRIVLPDFKILAWAYIRNNLDHFQPIRYASPENLLLDYVNYSIYGEKHVSMYDFPYLAHRLEQVGFSKVEEVPFDPEIDAMERKQFSFYTQAVKTT